MPTIVTVVGGGNIRLYCHSNRCDLKAVGLREGKLCVSVVERKSTTQQPSHLKKTTTTPRQYSKCTKLVQGFKRLPVLDECAAVVNYGADVQMEVELEH